MASRSIPLVGGLSLISASWVGCNPAPTEPFRSDGMSPEYPAIAEPASVYYPTTSASNPDNRYVLYPDGRFVHQARSSAGTGWHGWYTRADSLITFDYGTPYRADGVARADTLFVRYNEIMHHSGFRDETYVLAR